MASLYLCGNLRLVATGGGPVVRNDKPSTDEVNVLGQEQQKSQSHADQGAILAVLRVLRPGEAPLAAIGA
jgi:hypothetical protein